MQDSFSGNFTIKIDTSACKSIITGYDPKIDDTWHYSEQIFESGKIYGLVSEYGQGGMYLSYLLGGRVKFENVKAYCNGKPLCQKDLNDVSFNLEPCNEQYGIKKVRRSIEKALSCNANSENFQSVADRFLLTPERSDRKFKYLSGERWRAASALGYAQNKRIFFAPYKTSTFYYQMCQSGLLKALRELTNWGALVILPTGSAEFIQHIVDEVVYLDPQYNIDNLKRSYDQRFDEKWIR